jgi:hypothetical protein
MVGSGFGSVSASKWKVGYGFGFGSASKRRRSTGLLANTVNFYRKICINCFSTFAKFEEIHRYNSSKRKKGFYRFHKEQYYASVQGPDHLTIKIFAPYSLLHVEFHRR